MGGGGACKCTLRAGVVLCVGYWQSLANHSMRIQDLYVGTVPIPQFIKKIPEHAHTHTHAHVHTHADAHLELVQGDRALEWGVVLADFVQ